MSRSAILACASLLLLGCGAPSSEEGPSPGGIATLRPDFATDTVRIGNATDKTLFAVQLCYGIDSDEPAMCYAVERVIPPGGAVDFPIEGLGDFPRRGSELVLHLTIEEAHGDPPGSMPAPESHEIVRHIPMH